jgi:hypothetical protein
MDNVYLKSPSGEVREVEATPEALTPLMAAGWHQHYPESAPAAPAEEAQ